MIEETGTEKEELDPLRSRPTVCLYMKQNENEWLGRLLDWQ